MFYLVQEKPESAFLNAVQWVMTIGWWHALLLGLEEEAGAAELGLYYGAPASLSAETDDMA